MLMTISLNSIRIQILKTYIIVWNNGKPDIKIKNKKHVCALLYPLPIQKYRVY